MLVFLNGAFVPEEQAVISVFDRGFLYGDGLFETLRIFNGKPFRWREHMSRLRAGTEFLQIKLPFNADALRDFADQLVARNHMREALLRLTVSRGVGVRGYSPAGAERPVIVMSLHAMPDEGSLREWNLVTSSFRLPAHEPLAHFKTCNKLAQVLARAEADSAGADEALLLNTDGFVVEGSSSNLFWVEKGGTVSTPPLASGVLPGVTRMVVLEICGSLGVKTREANTTAEQLKRTEGVFLSLSSWGVVGVRSVDGSVMGNPEVIPRIRSAYRELAVSGSPV